MINYREQELEIQKIQKICYYYYIINGIFTVVKSYNDIIVKKLLNLKIYFINNEQINRNEFLKLELDLLTNKNFDEQNLNDFIISIIKILNKLIVLKINFPKENFLNNLDKYLEEVFQFMNYVIKKFLNQKICCSFDYTFNNLNDLNSNINKIYNSPKNISLVFINVYKEKLKLESILYEKINIFKLNYYTDKNTFDDLNSLSSLIIDMDYKLPGILIYHKNLCIADFLSYKKNIYEDVLEFIGSAELEILK